MARYIFVVFTALWLTASIFVGVHSHAETISGSKITPSTDLSQVQNFSIDQIADDITDDVYVDAVGNQMHNGFVSRIQSGVIRLDLDNTYSLNQFSIWNDVNIRREGVAIFRLEFLNPNNQPLATRGPFSTQQGFVDAQIYDFEPVENVSSVNLIVDEVFSTSIRAIEIREVSFEGVPYRVTTDGNTSPDGGNGDDVNVKDVVDLIDEVFGGGNNDTPSNSDPVAIDDRVEQPRNAGTLRIFNPLINDSDLDGDTLSISGFMNADPRLDVEILGSTQMSLDTSVFNQDLTVTYGISDGRGGSDEAVITYRVLQASDPLVDNRQPISTNDVLKMELGETKAINPLLNDYDPDGDSLVVIDVSESLGYLSPYLINTDTVQITAGRVAGQFDVSYIISDGQSGEVTGNIAVTVQDAEPENSRPIATDDRHTLQPKETLAIDLLDNDADRDGDTLSIPSLLNIDPALTVRNAESQNGYVSITAPADFGNYSFQYIVTDGRGGEDTGVVTVTIPVPDNAPPLAVDDFVELKINTNTSISALANDTDPERDSLAITGVSSGGESLGVSLTGQNKSTVSIFAGDQTGDYELVYAIADGRGGESQAKIFVKVVEEPNGPPFPEPADLNLAPGESMTFSPSITEPEGETTTISNIQTSLGLSATVTPDGSIQIQAVERSQETVTYTVTDEFGNTAEGAIAVNTAPNPPSAPIWPLVVGGLGLLGGGLAFAASRRPSPGNVMNKPPQAPSLPRAKGDSWFPPFFEDGETGGVPFAASPMLAGAVAAGPVPTIPPGANVPSGLQTLTGKFAHLRPAYEAIGRIGFAFKNPDTGELDYKSYGTGFLITDRHVMTNFHVFDRKVDHLTGEDCGGIEFIAERDREASAFHKFTGREPIRFDGLDVAIFELESPIPNGDRRPINRVAIEVDSLEDREVMVVGYPYISDFNDLKAEELAHVLEPDPVFGVKRMCVGKVFRHSTDTDMPYGLKHKWRFADYNLMDSLTHNASALSGNSGSPIIDMKTGELLGVHYGKKEFLDAEAANLAMIVNALTQNSFEQT